MISLTVDILLFNFLFKTYTGAGLFLTPSVYIIINWFSIDIYLKDINLLCVGLLIIISMIVDAFRQAIALN